MKKNIKKTKKKKFSQQNVLLRSPGPPVATVAWYIAHPPAERAPRRHWMDERRRANESEHLSQDMILLYD